MEDPQGEAPGPADARAFAIKWGLGPVEAMAKSLGMSSTHLNQPYIGCGFTDVPGGVRNELTLADAAKLYAAVSNGTALSGTARTDFFNFLVGGAPSASDPWGKVIAQVAAKLHKSAVVASFLASTNIRWKAGGYQLCLTGDGSCVPYKYDLSPTGWPGLTLDYSDNLYIPDKTAIIGKCRYAPSQSPIAPTLPLPRTALTTREIDVLAEDRGRNERQKDSRESAHQPQDRGVPRRGDPPASQGRERRPGGLLVLRRWRPAAQELAAALVRTALHLERG